jgi:LPXTG-motif cell wall-anchored protein
MCEVPQRLSASLLSLLLLPLFVQAQNKPAPTSFTSQRTTTTGEVVGELTGTWWVWLGVVAILGMVGLLFYLRKKTAD